MAMDAIYEERGSDWSLQVSALATTQWLQCDKMFPFSAKDAACETNPHCRANFIPFAYMHHQSRLMAPTGHVTPRYKY